MQGLELCVRPQPFVLDQTFRFHQSEHEFLKTTIRLQGVRWHASAALQQVPPSMPSSWGNHHAPPPAPLPIDSLSNDQPVWVRCSDPDAVAGVHEQRDATAPLEVSIKYRCGPSPSVARFLVLVYADAWQHRLLETWEIVVHSLERVDLHALVGQATLTPKPTPNPTLRPNPTLPLALPSPLALPLPLRLTLPPTLAGVARQGASQGTCLRGTARPRAVLLVRAQGAAPPPRRTLRPRTGRSQRGRPHPPPFPRWPQAVCRPRR